MFRRVRSDSVQSDQKSVQEEAEEEAEINQKLPGDWSLAHCTMPLDELKPKALLPHV